MSPKQKGFSSNLPFISTWKTNNPGSSTSTQIKVPTVSTGTYNCVVDWGDSTTSTITTYNDAAWTHTYSIAGTYTVSISGVFKGIFFNSSGDNGKITNISQWGILDLGNTASGAYFFGCTNMTITALDILNTSTVSIFISAFRNCASITSIPSIDSWDMSNITNMSFAFSGNTNFNGDISSWKTSKVTNFDNCFAACVNFNSDLSAWNIGSCTSMSATFSNCTTFNGNISTWNTSNVTNMNNILSNCAVFNRDIGLWNVSNVTQMSFSFSGCTILNPASIGTWNTIKLSNANSLFTNCTAWNQDISLWNIAALTTASNMLSGTAYNITNYNLLLNSITGWPSQGTINNSVTIHFGSAHYSGVQAIAGRAILTSTHSWTITDGGTP